MGVQSFVVEKMFSNVSKEEIQVRSSFCIYIYIYIYIWNREEFENYPVIFFLSSVVKCEEQIYESVFGRRIKYHKGKTFKRYMSFDIFDQKNHNATWK